MEIAKLVLEYIKVMVWPSITLLILFIYRSQISEIFRRVKSAKLPGGISIETFPEQLQKAKELSKEVLEERATKKIEMKGPLIPLTEVNEKMIKLELAPSPSGLDFTYYLPLAEQDPNLAFAGIRLEFEVMLKNLAKGFKVEINDKSSAIMVARKLLEHYAITQNQFQLISEVLKLCNAAIHGEKPSLTDVESILEIISVLKEDYVSWLSWGFQGGE